MVSLFHYLLLYIRKKEQFIINYHDIYYQARAISLKCIVESPSLYLVFNLLSLSQLDESLFQIIGLYIVILMFYIIVSIVHLPFRFKTIRYDR